jgi:hypothetical protein
VNDWDQESGQYREVKYEVDGDFMGATLDHKKLEILVVDPARLPAPKLAYIPAQTNQCQCGPLISHDVPWEPHQCVTISNLEDIMLLNRAALKCKWTNGPGKEYARLVNYYKAVVIPGVDYVPQEYLKMLETFLTLPKYIQKRFCEQGSIQ